MVNKELANMCLETFVCYLPEKTNTDITWYLETFMLYLREITNTDIILYLETFVLYLPEITNTDITWYFQPGFFICSFFLVFTSWLHHQFCLLAVPVASTMRNNQPCLHKLTLISCRKFFSSCIYTAFSKLAVYSLCIPLRYVKWHLVFLTLFYFGQALFFVVS